MKTALNCSLVVLCLLSWTTATLADSHKSKHRILAADYSKKRIAIIDQDGKIEWEHKIGPLHDLHMLPNGNILFQLSWTRIVEMNPKDNKIVWEYDSAKMNGNQGKRVEVHAFQRLKNGLTMIAESGVSRIIEVDKDGKIHQQIKLKVKKSHPHRDTRMVRKISNGNYLVCHEGDAVVKEYNPKGEVVWEFPIPLFGKKRKGGHGVNGFGNSVFGAIRLKNGNTLIATGNGHSVLEVTPEKKIVWKLDQNDIPGVQLAWVTTLQVLPNGNFVIGNCHAGPDNPQIIEVTRDKKLIWSYKNFKDFGNAMANSQILLDRSKKTDKDKGASRQGTTQKDTLNKAEILRFRKQFAEALPLYQSVIAKSSHKSEVGVASYYSAVCYQKMGQKNRAIEALRRFIRQYPGHQKVNSAKARLAKAFGVEIER